ncbi:DUF2505 family protein [Allosaccharopolyspora coralli]|uniref:DUF2505 family protein n=1 Tax=Allosaccharopolyspora coralli TaxID=2665642 RepID=A0A5Q3QB34_9PSEU|nr:DUF2505 domain-containing protein [Allosaccharopolyspora coralli]QGK71682.1 DUF2505 family protein [Allosaccharopolyspora coralli]
MARRIEHRSTLTWPAQQVHGALIDKDYLRDRLEALGGQEAELVEYTDTEDGVHVRMRQAVHAEDLPSVARTVVGEDVKIDRSETWRREDDGHFTGEVAAAIPGVPCTITGSMWLHDVDGQDGSCEFVVEGSVKVSVPFVGGKLEDFVAEQVQKLLGAEEGYTAEWLAQRS